jgi:hypothetical protein
MRRRPQLRDESGMVLIISIMLSLLMLGVALALLSVSDAETSLTGKQRVQ